MTTAAVCLPLFRPNHFWNPTVFEQRKWGCPLRHPQGFWRNGRYSVLRVTPQQTCLLNRLAVKSEVETVLLDLGIDPQADHDIDDLQQDQRHDHVVDDDDQHAFDLVQHLPGIAFDQARGAAVFADREDAGQDRTGSAADRMHAERIEGVIVTEDVFDEDRAAVADDAGGKADGERTHRADEARSRGDRDETRHRARADADDG